MLLLRMYVFLQLQNMVCVNVVRDAVCCDVCCSVERADFEVCGCACVHVDKRIVDCDEPTPIQVRIRPTEASTEKRRGEGEGGRRVKKGDEEDVDNVNVCVVDLS